MKKKGKKKYVTVKDAIYDLPPIKPGEGEKVEHNINKWNKYLSKVRSKNDNVLFDHVARTHLKDRKRYLEMSKNKWTFKELPEKNPHNHIKQRAFNNVMSFSFGINLREPLLLTYIKMGINLYIQIIIKNVQLLLERL